MKENIETTSLAWKQIADEWKTYFTPPSRVSAQETEKYQEWLRKLKEGKAPLRGLVLGVTPELRDALTEFEYQACSMDINVEMYLAMNELVEKRNPNEVFVRANWLDNPLANVPWVEREHLPSEVQRLLKPNGVFLTRAFCVPKEKSFATIDEVLEHFAKKEFSMQSALEMALELLILTYEPEQHMGSFTKAKELLEDYHSRKGSKFENENLQKIHDIVWGYWLKKLLGKTWIFAYRDEEEQQYEKYFKLEEVFEASDHDYGNITPMYILRKGS